MEHDKFLYFSEGKLIEMETKTEALLVDEIRDELSNLKKIELGTEQYKITVDGVTKLIDRLIEMRTRKQASEDKATELALKSREIEVDRKHRWVRVAIDIAGITIPVVVTVWGTVFTLKFEESGVVTTMMGKSFVGRLLMKCMKM